MFSKTTFSNGLRLILAPKKDTQAVTVLILFPVGSRHEKKEINGASHFLEHLMFKGTKKRPTTLDISRELDNIGAQYNAFTGKDHTGYYIKAAADKIELLFDILSDMLFSSVFDPSEIDKERNVIVEEINMYEDNPLMHVTEILEESVFEGNPLGWNIAGPREVIKKITRKQLLNYLQRHYTPHNMVVTVAGKLDPKKVKKLSLRYFGQKPRDRKKIQPKKFSGVQSSPRIKIMYKDTQQIQLAMGFPAYSYTNKSIYALYLLSVILGGNMSSRLFVNVREKNGLAYFIRASEEAYADTGLFTIQAGLDKSRIEKAIKLILEELKNMKEKGVTTKELAGAKDFVKGKIILLLEDSDHVADWYGKQELFLKKLETPEERLKKIQKVTRADVSRVAHEILITKKINLALIGPFKKAGPFKKLLKV